jgi:hypothetical protein
MFSVYEVNNLMKNKQKEKMATYEKIFEQCQKRIYKYAQNEKYRCFFDVPEFILGLPVYNLNSVILYIIEKLTKSGFLVKYFFPKHLYICWDLEEISGKKPQFGVPQSVTPKQLPAPPRLSMLTKTPLFPPPPIPTRNVTKSDQSMGNGNIIMPHMPSFDLPLPQSTVGNRTTTNSKFIKSISDYKPSGKFVLNI